MQSLAIALGCAALVLVGRSLTPDVRGYGTHEQLGLPPCNTMKYLSVPCVLCGMTTAFAHVVRGEVVAGASAQPVGALIAAAVLAAIPFALAASAFGRVPRMTVPLKRAAAVACATLAAGWAYKLIERALL